MKRLPKGHKAQIMGTRMFQTMYTADQMRKFSQTSKPLTDDEIKLVMDGRGEEGDDDYVKPAFDPFGISEDDLMNFARAIEAAHGIKGDA